MQTKHTPGPWFIEPMDTDGDTVIRITDEAGNAIALADYPEVCNNAAEAEANALLIAAAPDLLAALECLVARSAGLTESPDHDIWDARKIAKAAIAKARGEVTP